MAGEQDFKEIGVAKLAGGGQPEMVGGRYVLHAPIARGGMATIHLAHLLGAQGFHRLVTAKRLHPQFAENPDFVSMFHDEARIASRIHHPNVVPVLDVVASRGELLLVQEYVHGVPLSHLCSRAFRNEGGSAGAPIPIPIAVAIVVGILSGLDAAHETKDELGDPLHIVHRDVSPQNVLISADGVARLLDFGIAKARSSGHITRAGVLKGKVAYMAPEQLRTEPATRRVDIYATGIILWELLAHRHMRPPRDQAALLSSVLEGDIPPLREALALTPAAWTAAHGRELGVLEAILECALARRVDARFENAEAMGRALRESCTPATTFEVAEWVKGLAADYLTKRQQLLLSVETSVRARSGAYEVPKTEVAEMGFPSSSRVVVLAPQAPARSWRGLPWLALALLAAALVLVAARTWSPWSRENARTASVTSSTPSAASAVASAPTAPSAAPAPAPAPAPPPAPAPAEAVTGVALDTVPPVASAVPIPARRGKRRPAAAANPTVPAEPPAAAATPSAHAESCDPPFYFEGTKKVFKPNCI